MSFVGRMLILVGEIMLTTWIVMLYAGIIHSTVIPELPALGFWQAIFIAVPLSLAIDVNYHARDLRELVSK